MKVAIYARYSSDNQREASIADQFRMARLRAEKEGWTVVEEYSDHAISGSSMIQRPGIQALIMDSARGRFDMVLAEALDRISRDQEDIAGIYKRMRYADVKMFTLSEGEISELHVGLKGTMNALFLSDLADKTRRGQRGRVELGKSGGGNCYGYDVVRKLDGNGEPVRGDRSVNDAEAMVVRRIFGDYAAGKSPKRIAVELNTEGVPAPNGGAWGFSTINGNPKRGTGILNNEMYVGKLVWNRQRFVKDPDTGKRQARPNPESEWVIQDVPELRVVDDDLWAAVKSRQASIKRAPSAQPSTENHFRDRRRPKYLLSGLTKCGCCGGGYSMISATHVGCSTARNKGTCDNRRSIARPDLEERVLNALRHNLMDPELFEAFCEEFTREMNRLRIEGRSSLEAAESEIRRTERELDTLLNLILKGGAADRINEKMVALEKRKRELETFLQEADEPPPLLHPNMALHYRAKLDALYEALRHDTEARRMEAAEIIRSLVREIILTPKDGEVKIDVRGDLAGILAVSVGRRGKVGDMSKTSSPPGKTAQKSRPDGAAGLRELASQVEMVAGVGFEPTTFRL
jgi:site-specific DNA recombinase